jgi:hypothetical protein
MIRARPLAADSRASPRRRVEREMHEELGLPRPRCRPESTGRLVWAPSTRAARTRAVRVDRAGRGSGARRALRHPFLSRRCSRIWATPFVASAARPPSRSRWWRPSRWASVMNAGVFTIFNAYVLTPFAVRDPVLPLRVHLGHARRAIPPVHVAEFEQLRARHRRLQRRLRGAPPTGDAHRWAHRLHAAGHR